MRGKDMESFGISVLRKVTSDPFSRRMLYFSVAYSLYLILPVSWAFDPVANERIDPSPGYALSGYYGLVTAVMGFLCALTYRDGAVFPNSIVAKLIILGFFIYSNELFTRLIIELSYRALTLPNGNVIFEMFHFGIGTIFFILSPFLLLGALLTFPRTMPSTQ